ncbi:MAG: allophanate hydrolase subunit 2 family protein [Labilithrix sp.]|nr:allophanate hydrolase subunit 2 family protein [Labilithrix sp.]
MRDGVPPGGPLVRARFDLANHAAGNAAGACAIELSGTLEVAARGGRITIADDVAGAVNLAEGERHVVSTEGRARARYLALAGGIEAPVVLGGRGALLVAGIGGLLRRGARLVPLERATSAEARGGAPPAGSSTAAEGSSAPHDSFDDAPPILLMPGPDASDASRDALASRLFRVSAASDRTGTRLDGLAPSTTDIASHAQRSTPMVLGAIELTPSGLIVLGPDHPTTGGYPVVAVVRSSSLDRFFERPIGAPVRFVFS